jgi:hypothetical protein
MKATASDSPFREALLSGNAQEFAHLAQLVASGDGLVELEETEFAPYAFAMRRLRVTTRSSPSVAVRVDEESAVVAIEGPRQGLDVLSENFAALSDASPGYDIHIEWYPNHPYLAEESFPIVAQLTETP